MPHLDFPMLCLISVVFVILSVGFQGCARSQVPPAALKSTEKTETEPQVNKTRVLELFPPLNLYLKSCASGMRGFGSDRDPSRVGEKFLNQIRDDILLVTDKLLEQKYLAKPSYQMEIVDDVFMNMIDGVHYAIRSAIKDRRRNRLYDHGWLSPNIPTRFAILSLAARLFRKSLATLGDTETSSLKDVQLILIYKNRELFTKLVNSAAYSILINAFVLCHANHLNNNDDWICIRDAWTFLQAMYFVSICDSNLCNAKNIVKIVEFSVAALAEAAKTSSSTQSQEIWMKNFRAYTRELESAESSSSTIGYLLIEELPELKPILLPRHD